MQHVFKAQNYHGHRSSYIDYGTVVLTEETVHSHPHHHLSIYLVTKMMLWNWPIWKQPIVKILVIPGVGTFVEITEFTRLVLRVQFLHIFGPMKVLVSKNGANSKPITHKMQPKELKACEHAIQRDHISRRRWANFSPMWSAQNPTDMDIKAHQWIKSKAHILGWRC